jgi:hypothetical protein
MHLEKLQLTVWDQWIKEANAVGLPAQELLDLVLKTAKDACK